MYSYWTVAEVQEPGQADSKNVIVRKLRQGLTSAHPQLHLAPTLAVPTHTNLPYHTRSAVQQCLGTALKQGSFSMRTLSMRVCCSPHLNIDPQYYSHLCKVKDSTLLTS